MTPIELKAAIAALLAAEIGTYRATDTTALSPAIALLFDANQEQGDRFADGLEVVVDYAAAKTKNNMTAYGHPDSEITHKVSLIQHPTTGQHLMQTAQRKLQARFLRGYGSQVKVPSGSGALAEFTFLIPDSDLFGADRSLRP